MTLKQGLGVKLQKAGVQSRRVTTTCMSRSDLGVKPSTNLWVVDRQGRSKYTPELVLQFQCVHQTSKACLQLSLWTIRRRIYIYYIQWWYYLVLTNVQFKVSRVYGHKQFTAICLNGMILIHSSSKSKVSTLQIGGIQFQSMVYSTLVFIMA